MTTHHMPMLTLYYTTACHLCEEAKSLVMAYFAVRHIAPDSLTQVEIANDGELLERYGILIPVLKVEATGQELNWPFGVGDIEHLLANSDFSITPENV